MPQSSSARASARKRQQLIGPAALLGLVLLAAGALVLVFPGGAIEEQVHRYEGHDELSATYITNLLKTDPGNRKLRLTLVERELAQGDIAAARKALAPLLETAGGDPEVRLLEYRLLRAETWAVKDAAAAVKLKERARRDLAALAALEWEPRELAWLADEARALGAGELAGKLYGRLAARDPARAAEWADRASEAALGSGDYGAAAQALVAQAGRAGDDAARRELLVKAMRTLQSGNQLAAALALADAHLPLLAADDGALLYLMQLARAANDMARAQSYARLLLRMGRHGPARRALAALFAVIFRDAHAAEAGQGARAETGRVPAGMRPYNEAHYTLAYEVFLGAGNLDDAWRVASAAVAQVPENLAWRLRLAQVSEWSGRGPAALAQWRHLATRAPTARERDEAWQAVLRLAPGLRDDEALLAAWLHEARTRPMIAERWRRLADAFEIVGRPLEGAAFFGKRYEAGGEEIHLELHAFLLERVGRDEEAIAAYTRLVERHRATDARLLRAAVLLLRRTRFREAFELLDRHRGAVERANAEFWNLFADLAWRLQQDRAAQEAYRVLTETGKGGDAAWRRLVELTRERDPGGAARIAALGYERTRDPALLLLAAELHWQGRDLPALRELYGRVSPEDEKRQSANAYFFSLRAQFHDADGRPREAEADFRRAMAIEPANPDWTASLLWHLISRRDTQSLRRELNSQSARARETRALWEASAAGYALLGEMPRALAFYARLRDTKRDDYLWLLNYADVLEQAGQGAMALRVRRHAWQVLRAELGEKGVRTASRPEIETVARMVLAGERGDPALRLIARILRQDAAREARTGEERRLDAAVRELVLSWALSTERLDAAKAWLWQQYGRQLTRPVWAEMSIALAENDREAIARLLAADPAAIPVYDRIEAARVTGRIALAQSYAYEAQEGRRDDDELHLKLTETLLLTASSLAYGYESFERGLLKGREQRLNVAVWVTERLRLALDLGLDGMLATADASALTGVPKRIEQTGIAARWRHERAFTDVRLGYREALATHLPLQLTHTREWGSRISGVLGATLDEPAEETNPLFLGGMRSRLSASLNWRFALREYVSAEAWGARYHTQDGTYLGRGAGVTWEIGHWLRTEYPDWRVRLTGSHQSYRADGSVDARAARLDPTGGALGARYFIPESFDTVGAYLTFGDTYRGRYSRAMRLYADVGPTWNSELGEGFVFAVGGGSSVFGNDRLVAYFNRSKGGGAIGGYTTEWGLRYEYLFDR